MPDENVLRYIVTPPDNHFSQYVADHEACWRLQTKFGNESWSTTYCDSISAVLWDILHRAEHLGLIKREKGSGDV